MMPHSVREMLAMRRRLGQFRRASAPATHATVAPPAPPMSPMQLVLNIHFPGQPTQAQGDGGPQVLQFQP